MALMQMALNDPEGHFCCLKPFLLPYLWKYSAHCLWCVYTWRTWPVILTVFIQCSLEMKVLVRTSYTSTEGACRKLIFKKSIACSVEKLPVRRVRVYRHTKHRVETEGVLKDTGELQKW